MRLFALISSVVLALAVQTWADDTPRFSMFEKSFRHLGTYDNPYKDLTASAVLRRPDGKEWKMPLFWDGQAAWTLRVSPDLVGEWSYSIRSPDAGLNTQTGSFRCVASNRHGSIQPRRDHPLHFEYQDGTPFWFFGEKAWRAFQRDPAEKLDHQTAMHHVDVRAEQGFNYLHTELAGTGGLTSGGNEGGEMFLAAGKEVINPAFFQEVDSRLRHINEKGMICGMVLLYAKGDPCWKSLPDDEARLRFARYVVARYAAFDIVFLVTGEWHYMANQPDLFRAIGQEIRKTDPHGRMIGIHPGPESLGISSQDFAEDDWVSFGEYAQAYFAPHTQEATDANRDSLRKFLLAARKHNKPVVDAEYAYYLRDQDYDGIVDKPHSHTRDSFRRASWTIAMGGGYFVTGFGTTYFGGRREVGPFLVDNPKHKDAVSDLDHLHTFFTSLPWWLLDPHDERVTANGGYAYCLADAGKIYVVYVVGGKGAILKPDNGEYSVARYDPRTGQSIELPAVAGDLVPLVAPDHQDWVFLVKAMVRAGVGEKPPTAAPSQFGNQKTGPSSGQKVRIRVAGAQVPVVRDISENVETLTRAIEYATQEKADVLVTPEGSLSGYTPDFDAAATQQALDKVLPQARAAKLALVLGTCFEAEDGRHYDGQQFYDNEGKYLGFHAKILLCRRMANPAAKGEIDFFHSRPLRTFDLFGLTAGGLVCNDMWANPEWTPMDDPHLSQRLKEMGARVIFLSANTGGGTGESLVLNRSYHETNLRLRARAGKLWIVVANAADSRDNEASYCPSGVLAPDGTWAFTVPPHGEQLFVHTFEIDTAP